MKNYVSEGRTITVTAPANVSSGQLLVSGCLVGICSFDALAGSPVEVSCEGIFNIAKNPPDSLLAGQTAKIAAGGNVITSSGTLNVGWVLQNAPAASTSVMVKLCPSVSSPPTVLAAEESPAKGEHEHAGVGKTTTRH